jgi:hypothetical protein
LRLGFTALGAGLEGGKLLGAAFRSLREDRRAPDRQDPDG